MKIVTSNRFDKRVQKQPTRVQKELKKRLYIFIEDINNPILKVHKLSGKLKDMWSFNISGDIRVIFDKSQKDLIILVDIGSHSELYS